MSPHHSLFQVQIFSDVENLGVSLTYLPPIPVGGVGHASLSTTSQVFPLNFPLIFNFTKTSGKPSLDKPQSFIILIFNLDESNQQN